MLRTVIRHRYSALAPATGSPAWSTGRAWSPRSWPLFSPRARVTSSHPSVGAPGSAGPSVVPGSTNFVRFAGLIRRGSFTFGGKVGFVLLRPAPGVRGRGADRFLHRRLRRRSTGLRLYPDGARDAVGSPNHHGRSRIHADAMASAGEQVEVVAGDLAPARTIPD